MGKITSTKQILQIGKKNNKYIWDSKYFEKQNNESHIYLFQVLEIKKFLKKILNNYGLSLYKYNIDFFNSTLKIFISYFKTSEIKNIITKINTNHKLKIVKKRKSSKKYLYKSFVYRKFKKKKFRKNKILKIKTIIKFYKFYIKYFKQKLFVEKKIRQNFQIFYLKYKLKKFIEKQKFLMKFNYLLLKECIYSQQYFNKIKLNLTFKNKFKTFYNKYLNKQMISNFIENIKLKKLLVLYYQNYLKNLLVKYNNHKILIKTLLLNKSLYKKRLKTLRYYKNYKKIYNNKTIKNFKINNFLEQCNESLNIFTKNKFNNVLILQQINKNLVFNLTYRQLQYIKKITIQLRQFKNSNFFKEGMNIILSSLINPDNTNLLVKFITTQLRLTKRHGFFFKFLIKTLSLLLKYKFSKLKSIKILIKGRINGKPRAKPKSIFINKYMSLMTINSYIDFNQSTAYSSNGTFGVKLWVNKK